MPITAFTAPDDAVSSVCKDIGDASPGELRGFAHPATVPEKKALDGLHIRIGIEEATRLSSDMPPPCGCPPRCRTNRPTSACNRYAIPITDGGDGRL